MVHDLLKRAGLINTPPLMQPDVRSEKDWGEVLVEAAVSFASAYVECSIKQVSKRQPSKQRVDREISALINSGVLTKIICILMNGIRKEMEAEGVPRPMNEVARITAYRIGIRRLIAETKLMKRPPGRPKKQAATLGSMRMSHKKKGTSISADRRQGAIWFAAGAYLQHFILDHSPTLSDDFQGAKGHVKNEHAVDDVMASRAISYAARKFITKNALDPHETKALEKFLARKKEAIRKALIEELARR